MTLALWVTAAVLIASVLGGYLNWIAGRHERLAARADAAWAALDAQLIRRAVPARLLAVARGDDALADAADHALAGGPGTREDVENALGRALRRGGLGDPDEPPGAGSSAVIATRDVRAAAARIQLSRQFHNDAVRDLQALRRRWAARALRLGHGDRQGPGRAYFEIDDTVGTDPVAPASQRDADPPTG